MEENSVTESVLILMVIFLNVYGVSEKKNARVQSVCNIILILLSKKNLLTCTMFIQMAYSFAQDELWREIPIDPLILKVSYKAIYYQYPREEFGPKEQDVVYTEIGNAITHSYSAQERKFDLIMTEKERKEGRKTISFGLFHAQLGDCYINYPSGEQTIVINMHSAGRYKYTEPVLNIGWKIGKETKEIMGYTCTKATASHRGRDWTAWFTNDIPMSRGPLYFGGLPGLIMELSDSKENYYFECNGLEKPREATPICFIGREYVESTRVKTRKTEQICLRNPSAFFAEYGRKVLWAIDEPMEDPMPYNPVELK